MNFDEKIARARRGLDRMAPDMGRDNSVIRRGVEALFDAECEIARLRKEIEALRADLVWVARTPQVACQVAGLSPHATITDTDLIAAIRKALEET